MSSAFTGLAVVDAGLAAVITVALCVLVMSSDLPLFVSGVAEFATPQS